MKTKAVNTNMPRRARSSGRKPVKHVHRSAIPLEAKITSVKPNPRRNGSKSFRRYKLYQPGMTVGTLLEKGGLLAEVRWDLRHGNIALKPKPALKGRKHTSA